MEMLRLGGWGSSHMVNGGLMLRNNVHRCCYYYCYNNYTLYLKINVDNCIIT